MKFPEIETHVNHLGALTPEVAALTRELAFIITAYEPSLEIFESDYRTKRKP